MGFPETKLPRKGFFPRRVFPDNDRPKAQKSSQDWTRMAADQRDGETSREQNQKATPGGGKKEPGEYYIYDNCYNIVVYVSDDSVSLGSLILVINRYRIH